MKIAIDFWGSICNLEALAGELRQYVSMIRLFGILNSVHFEFSWCVTSCLMLVIAFVSFFSSKALKWRWINGGRLSCTDMLLCDLWILWLLSVKVIRLNFSVNESSDRRTTNNKALEFGLYFKNTGNSPLLSWFMKRGYDMFSTLDSIRSMFGYSLRICMLNLQSEASVSR